MNVGRTAIRRSDEVAEVIARDIRSGVLSTGTWLKQVDVERRYQASRADVRRALEILLQRRLVEQIPERGFYVPFPDERRHRELRELRVTLETSMAPSIINNATTGNLEELSALAQRFQDAVENGSIADRYEQNQAFHVALAQLCSNREVVKLVVDLRGYVPAAPMSQWPDMARARLSSQEHFAMIDAIKAGDVDELKKLFEAHIAQPDVGL
ncbi:FCD domain-containing protein [Agrobacterium vitis]|uniref:GntR family transcriptional regulator n=1 Tax=Agrobacterium vitis TaxID=373 RepID=UPI0012EA28A7|nr:GntR family transcriptional regulator [Agrobacterium vitis]MCE6076823.1 FCD domain-containing protein [Agrobacterium vitis]MUO84329.1 FCD domain-containing protein [Agrobacterium vitis]